MSNLYVRKKCPQDCTAEINASNPVTVRTGACSLECFLCHFVSRSHCWGGISAYSFSHCCFSLLSFAVICLCTHGIDLKSGRRPVATLDSFSFQIFCCRFCWCLSVFGPNFSCWIDDLLSDHTLVFSEWIIFNHHPSSSVLDSCYEVFVAVFWFVQIQLCTPKPAMFLERKSFAMATVPNKTDKFSLCDRTVVNFSI